MAINRRTALKGLAAAGTAVVAAPAVASARSEQPTGTMMGMLFDATECIGCQACMVACRQEFGLEYEPTETLWDRPVDLSARTKNIIKLASNGPEYTFMKMQCMHCIDPACASACMLGAFSKDEHGAVTWDGDLCVGCRYCQIGCPYNVPKFEWDKANPKIVKCEMCPERRAEGREPACVEVCPREAVIYGTREELLQEAHRRIETEPERYNPHVYGEKEAGGTQVLYLAPKDVTFQQLGLPLLGERSLPDRVRGVQGVIYKGFAAPVALYGVLAAVIFRNQRSEKKARQDQHTHEGEEKTQ